MKISRKFVSCLFAIGILTAVFFFLIYKTPWAIQFQTYVVYGFLVTTITFAYIGGNVWSQWTRSKYFRNELMDK